MTETVQLDYKPKSIDYENFLLAPKDYQNYVIRILSMQAYAEKLGADEMGCQLRLAPDAGSRKALARIVSDEANHAYMLYHILETIGVSETEAIHIAEGKSANSNPTQSLAGAVAVGDEDNQWIDLVLNNMLMDRAGSFMVGNFCNSSFSPWAIACDKIYQDEQWHKAFGLKQFQKHIRLGEDHQLPLKFSTWYARALNFFGPPSIKTQAKLAHYGIKRHSNEELRQAFISEVTSILIEHQLERLILPTINDDYPYTLLAQGK
jgi:1,2-phenylacetyl-CoA epoxidase catalytic subunit